jgi:hypothetical protein
VAEIGSLVANPRSQLLKPLTLPNIIQIKSTQPGVYEDLVKMQDHINAVTAPAPAPPAVRPSSFGLSAGLGVGASVSAVSGSIASGKVTITIGTSGTTTNPTFTLNLPRGTFTGTPFATFVKSGGTGTLPISYSETTTGVTVTFIGTPSASTTYTFNFTVQD